MDGLQAAKALRERGISTPIVALTASSLASEREACMAEGMNGFVAKPFRPSQLVEAVHRHRIIQK